jgi:outer membrane protein insertion porin family
LLAAPVAAQDTSGYLDKPVARVDIVFERAGVADDGEFRALIEQSVRAGDPLSAEGARGAVARLVERGLASQVAVEVEPAAGDASRVVVRFRITRQVRVVATEIEGGDALAEDALRDRVSSLGTGDPLTQPRVERGAEEILRYYHDRGYFEARVRSDVRSNEAGTGATVVYTVSPGERARVSAFEIVGDVAVPADQLRSELQLRPGAPFTQAALAADVDRIRRAHLTRGYLAPVVSEPEVDRNPAANTVAIRTRVVSGPRVTVAVEGAEFSQADLERLLPIYAEGGIDDFQLAEGSRRLTEELQRDGYFFARVSYALQPASGSGARRVVYTVDRGRRYRVSDIEVEGTTALSFADLQPALRSQESGFFSRGLTSRELIARDAETIEQRLRSIGYRRAAVTERRLGVSPDSDDLVITFVVEEGPRSRVEEVKLRGNRVFSSEELIGDSALLPEDPSGERKFYSDEALTADANRILERYAADGFVTAEVTTQLVELDPERVRVVFDVSEGRKAFIGDVVISGNARTREESLRAYFTFSEGQVLRLDDLRRTEQALYETGAFRQVIIYSEATGTMPDGLGELRTVHVTIEEGSPWVLTYGGGYNTDDGPRGLFEVSNLNLFGRINTGSVRMRASRRDLLGEISYTNPVPFGFDLPALVSLRYEREVREAFTAQRFTGLIQLQQRIDEQSILFYRYQFQFVRPFDLQISEREIRREDRRVRLGRVSVTYLRDTRNNPFDPDDGTFMSLDGSVAASALGGNTQYTRFFGEYQRYDRLPKVESVIYAGAVKFGVADPYGSSRRLPISERFFSGGARTLRGFGFEQAGPRDPVTDQPVGGNVLVVLNNELRFPLFWRFGGAVFSDTGNVFRRLRDVDLGEITETVGAGVRVDTPVGPVRVDLGYLLNGPDGVKNYAVHFSYGQAF